VRCPANYAERTAEREVGVAELSPGSRLGRYTVERLVGRGAVADVFLAHDEQLAGRQVALKVFRDGGEQLRQRAALAL